MLNSRRIEENRGGDVSTLSEQRFERVMNDVNRFGNVDASKLTYALEEERKKFAEMKLENLNKIEEYK